MAVTQFAYVKLLVVAGIQNNYRTRMGMKRNKTPQRHNDMKQINRVDKYASRRHQNIEIQTMRRVERSAA